MIVYLTVPLNLLLSPGGLPDLGTYRRSARLVALDRVSQRSAESGEGDLDHVSRFIPPGTLREAELAGAEEMNVDVPREAMLRKLEVVVLQVGEGVRHVLRAGQQLTGIIDDFLVSQHPAAA